MMIHPIHMDRANNHVCDIRLGNRFYVSDSHKKSTHVEPMGSQNADG